MSRDLLYTYVVLAVRFRHAAEGTGMAPAQVREQLEQENNSRIDQESVNLWLYVAENDGQLANQGGVFCGPSVKATDNRGHEASVLFTEVVVCVCVNHVTRGTGMTPAQVQEALEQEKHHRIDLQNVTRSLYLAEHDGLLVNSGGVFYDPSVRAGDREIKVDREREALVLSTEIVLLVRVRYALKGISMRAGDVSERLAIEKHRRIDEGDVAAILYSAVSDGLLEHSRGQFLSPINHSLASLSKQVEAMKRQLAEDRRNGALASRPGQSALACPAPTLAPVACEARPSSTLSVSERGLSAAVRNTGNPINRPWPEEKAVVRETKNDCEFDCKKFEEDPEFDKVKVNPRDPPAAAGDARCLTPHPDEAFHASELEKAPPCVEVAAYEEVGGKEIREEEVEEKAEIHEEWAGEEICGAPIQEEVLLCGWESPLATECEYPPPEDECCVLSNSYDSLEIECEPLS